MDLRLEAGERVLLLGASGAGKSTLLLGLAGLLDPAGGGEAEGELRVRGRPATTGATGTGIVFQDPDSQLVMARAGDDVAFGLENLGVPPEQIWPRVDRALAAAGFPHGRRRSTQALSGGEKQRLALAGVLALRPSLLLFDEPTANLDPDGAAAFRAAVAAAIDRSGATLVLVEHRVADSLPLVDRVVVLDAADGVVADGRPDRVLDGHGDELAAAGIWVPGRPVRPPPRRSGPEPQPLVTATDVHYHYATPGMVQMDDPGPVEDVLAGVDVTVDSACATALVGPNGSGKSTLLVLLAGLLRPSRGSVTAAPALRPHAAPAELWRWPARQLAERVGVVFQDPEHHFLTRRVDDELALGPRLADVSEVEVCRRVTALLERLRLSSLAAANPFTLSGGEKRRLSVATTLATAPALLLLDEPTFGQDRVTWAELLQLLADLRDDGRGVVLATHDLDFAGALADATVRLDRGRVAAVSQAA